MIDKATHRHIIYQLLKDIFSLPEAKYIAFKWGTMAYFFHALPRFSTDIDLDLLHQTSQSKTYEHISLLAQKYGTVKFKKHLLLSYKEWYDHIKIDLSRKVWQHATYRIIDFYGTSIQVQDTATMVANKLVVCTERIAQRDIFDVWYFLYNNFPINTSLITERTGKSMHSFWSLLLITLQDIPASYKFLDGLWELVDEQQKQFIKSNLRTDLINLVQFRKDFGDKNMQTS